MFFLCSSLGFFALISWFVCFHSFCSQSPSFCHLKVFHHQATSEFVAFVFFSKPFNVSIWSWFLQQIHPALKKARGLYGASRLQLGCATLQLPGLYSARESQLKRKRKDMQASCENLYDSDFHHYLEGWTCLHSLHFTTWENCFFPGKGWGTSLQVHWATRVDSRRRVVNFSWENLLGLFLLLVTFQSFGRYFMILF